MTSQQRLSQQLALTSRNLKFGSHSFVASRFLEAAASHCSLLKRALSNQYSIFWFSHCSKRANDKTHTVALSQGVQYSDVSSSCKSKVESPGYGTFVHDSDERKKCREQIWKEMFKQTSYFFHEGLRHVYPYYHTYHVNVKARWIGCTIEDAFKSSYYAVHDENWVERDILNESLTVNGSPTSKDYVLTAKDKIQHTVHRHELPVLDAKVDVLYCDSHIAVVNKPPSIPIHPTGRYQHNTILYILVREHQMYDAHIIHRLDMGTSGVLLLGRSKSAATFFSLQMMNRKASKTYVARVVGKFPNGVVECDEALTPIDLKSRIMKVCSSGKPSKTSFERLSYNPATNTSVVVCKPHTGRTHQVRVHLQYLGHPIHNDPLYNNIMFGSDRAKGGNHSRTAEEIIKCWESDRSRWNRPEDVKVSQRDLVYEPWNVFARRQVVDHAKAVVDNNCEICPMNLIVNKEDMGFHLHALEYKGSDWCFSSPLPDWADSSWDGAGS